MIRRRAFLLASATLACAPAREPTATADADRDHHGSARGSSDGPPTLERHFAEPGPVGDYFRALVSKLPEPSTLSEHNGFSLVCPDHGAVTYTLLESTARTAPVVSDQDLVAAAPWTRHEDVCIRHVAMSVVMDRIGTDREQISTGVDDPEHHQHHAVLRELQQHLDDNGIAFDRSVFAGLHLTVNTRDFERLLHGEWREVAEGRGVLDVVTIRSGFMQITAEQVAPQRDFPSTTYTTAIGDVVVNDQAQFEVRGRWTVESNDRGWRGDRQPAGDAVVFWPVSDQVMWMRQQPSAYWQKLETVAESTRM